jgi:hypothetical protein
MRLSCLLLGHEVVDLRPAIEFSAFLCACGEPLVGNVRRTRIRHVIGCFLQGHNYARVCSREGHDEYRCIPCGHPLLFPSQTNPYASQNKFRKKVRYLCNLFGHAVHPVTAREGLLEYACDCGHTFLKREADSRRITHPLICLFTGHSVFQISQRNGLVELVCRNCGHTFLL